MKLLILGLLCLSSSVLAELPDISATKIEMMKIEVLFAKGDVWIRRGTKKIKAKKRIGLLEKDDIVTGDNSLAVIQIESSTAQQTLKVEPNSRLTLSELADDKQISRLNTGSVFVYLKSKFQDKSRNPKVILKAKSIAMGVRGTEFFASFGPKDHEEDFWMCVNEGKVHVTTKQSKEGVLVNEGEGIQIAAREKLESPRAYKWTKNLNWNNDPNKGDLKNSINLEDHYSDVLDQDYD
jgi:hypothetical protein